MDDSFLLDECGNIIGSFLCFMAEYLHDKVTMCMLNMATVVSMVTMVEMETTNCLIVSVISEAQA